MDQIYFCPVDASLDSPIGTPGQARVDSITDIILKVDRSEPFQTRQAACSTNTFCLGAELSSSNEQNICESILYLAAGSQRCEIQTSGRTHAVGYQRCCERDAGCRAVAAQHCRRRRAPSKDLFLLFFSGACVARTSSQSVAKCCQKSWLGGGGRPVFGSIEADLCA